MPDVHLRSGEGRVSLRELLRGRALVVYFYPKDDTPGCTAQACSFRDSYEDFVAAGADVVGVSSDEPDSHARFAERHRLPFKLLTDEGGAARRAFGVGSTLGLFPGRVTFVADANGIVRHVFESQLRVGRHIDEALRVVKTLASNP